MHNDMCFGDVFDCTLVYGTFTVVVDVDDGASVSGAELKWVYSQYP